MINKSAILYSIIYAMTIITYQLSINNSTTSIIEKNDFLLIIIESIILLFMSMFYKIVKLDDEYIEINKYMLVSGICFCLFIKFAMLGIQYSNSAFVANMEGGNILMNYIVEIYYGIANIKQFPIILSIIITTFIGNYGLEGIQNKNVGIAYLFCILNIISENITGIIISKNKKECKISSFIYFNLGILLSALFFYIVELYIYEKITEKYSSWIYVNIIINCIYIFCYFFLVDLYGITFDSVSCSISMLWTMLFIVSLYGSYDIIMACCGTICLVVNSLYYIFNNY